MLRTNRGTCTCRRHSCENIGTGYVFVHCGERQTYKKDRVNKKSAVIVSNFDKDVVLMYFEQQQVFLYCQFVLLPQVLIELTDLYTV